MFLTTCQVLLGVLVGKSSLRSPLNHIELCSCAEHKTSLVRLPRPAVTKVLRRRPLSHITSSSGGITMATHDVRADTPTDFHASICAEPCLRAPLLSVPASCPTASTMRSGSFACLGTVFAYLMLLLLHNGRDLMLNTVHDGLA